VLSADGLRRDLLESGISAASSVAIVQSGGSWDDGSLDETAVPSELDVAVIDMCRAEAIERGLEIGREIKSLADDPAIVVLAGSSDILADIRKRMAEVGPKWSFLTTDLITDLDDLVRIISSAASGMTIVDPGFFTDTNGDNGRDAYLTRPLTARQMQVLELVS
jgi:DNA-binding NarL/FixJ family response regulator